MPDPYDIHTPPANSLGCGETKKINWTYFKDFFKNYVEWKLETNTGSGWFINNTDLTIEKTWIEDGERWKFNLILGASYTGDYRLTFGVDRDISDYVDKTEEGIYELKIPIPGTPDFYDLIFDWNDIKNIPSLILSKGINNNKFWFRIRKDNIISGAHLELDPTFGITSSSSTSYKNSENYILMSKFTMGGTNGTADSISARMIISAVAKKTKCAILDSSFNLLTNGETEELDQVQATPAYLTYNFPTSPSLTASTDYYLCVWGESSGGSNNISYSNTGGQGGRYDSMTYTGSYPNPCINDGFLLTSPEGLDIYCTYTESGGADEHLPTDTAKATDAKAFKAGYKPLDTAKASDIIAFVKAKHEALGDTAKSSDLAIFKAGLTLSDIAKATDAISFVKTHYHTVNDTAKATDSVNYVAPGTHSPGDTAKASDIIAFVKAKHEALGDTAKSSDLAIFKAGLTLSDIAKATDSINFVKGRIHSPSDTAKATDSIAFVKHHYHAVNDTAKATDTLEFVKDKHITLGDTAKASDTVAYLQPITAPTENLTIWR